MAADADGFISVSDTRRGRRQQQRVDANGQKKNKKQRQRREQGAVASPLLRTEEELLEYSPAEVSRLVAAVQQLRRELKDCDTANVLQEQVEAALKAVNPKGSRPELACYGIGALLGRRAEQYQLAWFLNLAERLGTAATPTLFDPVLNASERVALAQLGCRVPRENNGCRHVAGSEAPLLVYMPHGGLRMYDNLLSVNAAAGVASKLCIVGNDLQGYVDAMRKEELATCAPALTAFAAALQCADPPPPFSAVPGAFNDTIAQWLDCDQLPDVAYRPVDGAGDAVGHDFSIVERDLPALPPAAAAAVEAASETKAL